MVNDQATAPIRQATTGQHRSINGFGVRIESLLEIISVTTSPELPPLIRGSSHGNRKWLSLDSGC